MFPIHVSRGCDQLGRAPFYEKVIDTKSSKCDSNWIVTMTIVLVRLAYSKVIFVFGVDIGSACIGKFSIVYFPESYKQASGAIV